MILVSYKEQSKFNIFIFCCILDEVLMFRGINHSHKCICSCLYFGKCENLSFLPPLVSVVYHAK